jgi:AAA domain
MSSSDEIIINDLAHLPVWVGWREVQRNGETTKVPYNPRTGEEAKSTDPTTWSTRGEAETWAAFTNHGGVGIVLSQLNGGDCCLCGIDLDTCRDPNTETLQGWAREVIDRFKTYTEVSPSGTGAKLFFMHASADLPAIERLFGGKGGRQFKNGGGKHCPAIEVYRAGRSFTVTDESIGPIDILRQVPLADLEWPVLDAGPRFAHKESQKSGSGNDQSRSGKAFRKGATLKAAGYSYDAMRDALLADEDPEIAEWARTKGLANNERELHRIYENAGNAGTRPETPAFPLIAWKDVAFDLEEEWRVERVLPLVGIGCLYGGPGSVKTFVLLDLFARMARGGFWGGREVKQCPVVYIAAEGGNGIKKRIAGLKKVAAEKGLPADIPFHLITVAPNLGTGDGDCKKLIADIEATGAKLGAIAIDTTTQALGGADENGAGMDALVVNATAIAAKFQCLVVLVHHTPVSDDDRLRGKGSLLGGLDVSIISKREKGSFVATMTIKKMRDEDETQSFAVSLVRVVLGHTGKGREVSTLVVETVEPSAEADKKPKSGKKLPPCAVNALAALRYAIDEVGQPAPPSNHIPRGRTVVLENQWRNYATVRALMDNPDTARRDFVRGCVKLLAEEMIGIWDTYIWEA